MAEQLQNWVRLLECCQCDYNVKAIKVTCMYDLRKELTSVAESDYLQCAS